MRWSIGMLAVALSFSASQPAQAQFFPPGPPPGAPLLPGPPPGLSGPPALPAPHGPVIVTGERVPGCYHCCPVYYSPYHVRPVILPDSAGSIVRTKLAKMGIKVEPPKTEEDKDKEKEKPKDKENGKENGKEKETDKEKAKEPDK
jgi:hypothetical protein